MCSKVRDGVGVMRANDCEFGDLNLECLTVERATFKDIEKLDFKCIFELPGVKARIRVCGELSEQGLGVFMECWHGVPL